jgi:hypothetical protein
METYLALPPLQSFFNCLGFKPKAIEKRLKWRQELPLLTMPEPFAPDTETSSA